MITHLKYQHIRLTEPMAADTLARQYDIACLDASNRLVPGEDGVEYHACGVFEAEADNTTAATGGAAGAIEGEVLAGQWGDFPVTGTVPSLLGLAYVAGPRTVSGDPLDGLSNPRGVAGIVTRVLGTTVRILFTSTTRELIAIRDGMPYYGRNHVADVAALAAIAPANRFEGLRVSVDEGRSSWVFDADSALAATTDTVVVPDTGTGRWLRADQHAILRLPVTYETADAAVLWTPPEGMAAQLTGYPFWEVTTPFTGGTSSAIGASTSISGYDTKGDLIGGATGAVAAGLTAGLRRGTVGAELNDLTGFSAMLFVEGDEIRFDRITSVFTAGAGYICVPVCLYHLAPATP